MACLTLAASVTADPLQGASPTADDARPATVDQADKADGVAKANRAAKPNGAARADDANKAGEANNAEADRIAVWNSPEMLAARAWLEDYFLTSRRYTESEARRYLTELQQIDANAMRLWLARIERTQRRVAKQRQAAEADRLYRLARANAVQQQRAINLAKLEAAQSARSRLAQAQIDDQRRFGQSAFLARTASREETLRTQIAGQNLRNLLIVNLLDQQELRRDLRSRGR